jgi:hypothetical protein
MMASKNPVNAPRNASVIERLLNVRSPWLVRMNPVYAIVAVQRITRTPNMGDHLLISKFCHNSSLWSEGFCNPQKKGDFDIPRSNPVDKRTCKRRTTSNSLEIPGSRSKAAA